MAANIFQHAERAGVFHIQPKQIPTLTNNASKSHLQLLTTDLSAASTLAETLRQLGSDLNFPGWYGANLDALNDSLSDSDWHAGKGQALFISGLEDLRHRHPAEFATLIDVLQSVAENRSGSQHPLWVLVTTPAQGLARLPEA
jgi:RNAse (barnase) inhibitor barstar